MPQRSRDAQGARRPSARGIDLGGDVTGNGISRLVFTILSAVAEAERDCIRERVFDEAGMFGRSHASLPMGQEITESVPSSRGGAAARV